ncbi:class II fructose-bisphosphate aldolase, partial [Clostridium sp. Cult1]|uniref:class II fructose-bisphosphate aldolase n=1 Tax=Clostridium sp. Cult1 TaxID=2079002 RepID=UPI001F022518
FTDPNEAKKFVDETGVDYLAIAVGTAHGVYKGEPRLDFDRIKTIKDILNIPLVLHGSSGVPKEAIEKAVSLGINKINIDTDLRVAFSSAIKDFLKENPDNIDPRKILGPAKEAMKEVIKEKMELFGSVGRA